MAAVWPPLFYILIDVNLNFPLISGEEASKEDCPIFVAASHSSFFDGIVIPFLKMPITLSREENKDIPFMGKPTNDVTAPFSNRLSGPDYPYEGLKKEEKEKMCLPRLKKCQNEDELKRIKH